MLEIRRVACQTERWTNKEQSCQPCRSQRSNSSSARASSPSGGRLGPPSSMARERNEAFDRDAQRAQFLRAVQIKEVDHEAGVFNHRAGTT